MANTNRQSSIKTLVGESPQICCARKYRRNPTNRAITPHQAFGFLSLEPRPTIKLDYSSLFSVSYQFHISSAELCFARGILFPLKMSLLLLMFRHLTRFFHAGVVSFEESFIFSFRRNSCHIFNHDKQNSSRSAHTLSSKICQHMLPCLQQLPASASPL